MNKLITTILTTALLTIANNAKASSLLFDFYASDWAGPNNSWNSRTGNQTLFYDTFNGSAPQAGTSSIAGVSVATTVFDGNDFFTSTFAPGRPWAGLNQFSLSIVFKSNTIVLGSETNINAFWNHEGILGFERAGAGQGEFAVSLYDDGSLLTGAIAASTGLGAGDTGVFAGRINDNSWHVLSLVVTNETQNFFSQTVYVDGIQADSSLLQYGTPGTLADDSFSLGAIRFGGPNSQPFVGEVAALRFDDAPLTSIEISSMHNDYLGLIPEPNTTTLLLLGLAGFVLTRQFKKR